MASGTYAPDPFEQYCDDNGDPLSSGTLTTYSAGTSTPVATYSDVNLTVANTNPISLDAAGRPTSGAIFLTPGISYKFLLKNSLGATVATRDNVAAVPLNPNVTGTFIPVIGGTTSTSGQTYVAQGGTYIKLGTLVIASFFVQLSAKGAIVGNLQITGLPFPSTSVGFPGYIGLWAGANTAFVGIQIFTQLNSFTITALTAASTSTLVFPTTADISDSFELAGTVIYTTSS